MSPNFVQEERRSDIEIRTVLDDEHCVLLRFGNIGGNQNENG